MSLKLYGYDSIDDEILALVNAKNKTDFTKEQLAYTLTPTQVDGKILLTVNLAAMDVTGELDDVTILPRDVHGIIPELPYTKKLATYDEVTYGEVINHALVQAGLSPITKENLLDPTLFEKTLDTSEDVRNWNFQITVQNHIELGHGTVLKFGCHNSEFFNIDFGIIRDKGKPWVNYNTEHEVNFEGFHGLNLMQLFPNGIVGNPFGNSPFSAIEDSWDLKVQFVNELIGRNLTHLNLSSTGLLATHDNVDAATQRIFSILQMNTFDPDNPDGIVAKWIGGGGETMADGTMCKYDEYIVDIAPMYEDTMGMPLANGELPLVIYGKLKILLGANNSFESPFRTDMVKLNANPSTTPTTLIVDTEEWVPGNVLLGNLGILYNPAGYYYGDKVSFLFPDSPSMGSFPREMQMVDFIKSTMSPTADSGVIPNDLPDPKNAKVIITGLSGLTIEHGVKSVETLGDGIVKLKFMNETPVEVNCPKPPFLKIFSSTFKAAAVFKSALKWDLDGLIESELLGDKSNFTNLNTKLDNNTIRDVNQRTNGSHFVNLGELISSPTLLNFTSSLLYDDDVSGMINKVVPSTGGIQYQSSNRIGEGIFFNSNISVPRDIVSYLRTTNIFRTKYTIDNELERMGLKDIDYPIKSSYANFDKFNTGTNYIGYIKEGARASLTLAPYPIHLIQRIYRGTEVFFDAETQSVEDVFIRDESYLDIEGYGRLNLPATIDKTLPRTTENHVNIFLDESKLTVGEKIKFKLPYGISFNFPNMVRFPNANIKTYDAYDLHLGGADKSVIEPYFIEMKNGLIFKCYIIETEYEVKETGFNTNPYYFTNKETKEDVLYGDLGYLRKTTVVDKFEADNVKAGTCVYETQSRKVVEINK